MAWMMSGMMSGVMSVIALFGMPTLASLSFPVLLGHFLAAARLRTLAGFIRSRSAASSYVSQIVSISSAMIAPLPSSMPSGVTVYRKYFFAKTDLHHPHPACYFASLHNSLFRNPPSRGVTASVTLDPRAPARTGGNPQTPSSLIIRILEEKGRKGAIEQPVVSLWTDAQAEKKMLTRSSSPKPRFSLPAACGWRDEPKAKGKRTASRGLKGSAHRQDRPHFCGAKMQTRGCIFRLQEGTES